MSGSGSDRNTQSQAGTTRNTQQIEGSRHNTQTQIGGPRPATQPQTGVSRMSMVSQTTGPRIGGTMRTTQPQSGPPRMSIVSQTAGSKLSTQSQIGRTRKNTQAQIERARRNILAQAGWVRRSQGEDVDSAQTEIEENNPYSMTEQDLRNKLSEKDYGRIPTQIYAGCMACLSAIIFGTSLGWSSPVTDQLLQKNVSFSWMPCLVPLGAAMGAIPSSYLMDSFGPRSVLLVASFVSILVWILLAFPIYDSVLLHSFMRFFNGLVTICHRLCGETLLIDTVHKSLVCKMYVCFQSTVYLGVSLVQLLGAIIQHELLSVFCLVFPLLHFVMIYFAPESPVFLMKKNETTARKSLIWYRGEKNIYNDMHLMKRDSEFYRLDVETYRYMIYAPVVKKALLIILGTQICRWCTGYYILLMYSCGHIFYGTHVAKHPKEILTLIGLTFYISNFICLTIHINYELPVRPPLIISCIGSSICLSLIALCIMYSDFIFRYLVWLPIVLGMILIFFADFGVNYIPKVLLLEYMPFQVYKMALTYATVAQWFGVFLLLWIFEWFRSSQSKTYIYIFFMALSGCSFIGAIYCYLFVVETKGKSLLRVQLDLGGNPVGTRAAHNTRFRIDTGRKKSTTFLV